jgi:hypothetical protein
MVNQKQDTCYLYQLALVAVHRLPVLVFQIVDHLVHLIMQHTEHLLVPQDVQVLFGGLNPLDIQTPHILTPTLLNQHLVLLK